MKEFVFTLDYYSPKAYEFIRHTFGKNLPHVSTLRKWYAYSQSNGEPGKSRESISMLKNLVEETQKMGKTFDCSITFDEVHIRRHVQYCAQEQKFSGFVTYGRRDGELPIASQAIVFMVNALDRKLSLPVCYHFINELNAEKKANLIKSVIAFVTQTNANILNITCDGLITSFTAFELLGASLKSTNLQPSFRNPVNDTKINIMFDACHMLKLVRNYIDGGDIEDGQGRLVKWTHFKQLEQCRVKDDFVTHKINKTHIEFQNKIMKVSLAAELLSKSVARSMEYLMTIAFPGFEECAPTIEFVDKINDLFDILNTGIDDNMNNNNHNIYKTPLSIQTAPQTLHFLNECAEYIKTLKINGKRAVDSRKKGFLGFLIDITSLISIYEEYVETGKLAYIATFPLSQDPLEALFGRIRAKGGFNSNPTVGQFKAAYRKTAVNGQIKSSSSSNCVDKLSIYHTPSTKKTIFTNELVDEITVHYDDVGSFSTNDYLLDGCKEATLCRIAGNIEHTIRTNGVFSCQLCLNVFNENDCVSETIINKGDRSPPCVSTVHICKIADKYLHIFKQHLVFDHKRLLEIVIDETNHDIMYPKTDFSIHEAHKYFFVECIASEFIRIRATEIAREITINLQKKTLSNKARKIQHFTGR